VQCDAILSIVLTNPAKEDLIGIWLYGEMNWGVVGADQYLDPLDDFLQTLINSPERFALRRDVKPPVRIATFKSHLVVFPESNKHIHVMRLLHQTMDVP
jgi:plasmid stabilization system protein ParE